MLFSSSRISRSRSVYPGLALMLFAVASAVVLPSSALAADDYTIGPDALPQVGVPQGKVTRHSWESKIFPNTTRDYWVYVPAQYDASKPAALMVFQDGEGCVKIGRAHV